MRWYYWFKCNILKKHNLITRTIYYDGGEKRKFVYQCTKCGKNFTGLSDREL
jgi:rRNA maturation endonuclease Nob1